MKNVILLKKNNYYIIIRKDNYKKTKIETSKLITTNREEFPWLKEILV